MPQHLFLLGRPIGGLGRTPSSASGRKEAEGRSPGRPRSSCVHSPIHPLVGQGPSRPRRQAWAEDGEINQTNPLAKFLSGSGGEKPETCNHIRTVVGNMFSEY